MKLRPGEEWCPACGGEDHGCEVCDETGRIRPVFGGCVTCGQDVTDRAARVCDCGAETCANDWCEWEHQSRRFGPTQAECPAWYARFLAFPIHARDDVYYHRDLDAEARRRAVGVVTLSIAALGDRMRARAADSVADALATIARAR